MNNRKKHTRNVITIAALLLAFSLCVPALAVDALPEEQDAVETSEAAEVEIAIEETEGNDKTEAVAEQTGSVQPAIEDEKTVAESDTNQDAEAEPNSLRTDHPVFLSGYGNGKFGPEDTLSRAQTCQILYNLLADTSEGSFPSAFSDVKEGSWYYTAVTVLASRGILDCDGGTFRPEEAITRADFVRLVVGLVGVDKAATCSYKDVSISDTIYPYVATATQHGWIVGTDEGKFLPNDTLKRGQAAAVFNRIQGRSMDVSLKTVGSYISPFSDVTVSRWDYADICEAAVAHTAVANGTGETWSDYLHTYPVTYQWDDGASMELVTEGKFPADIPAISCTHWLVASNGSVADPSDAVVTAPVTYVAWTAPALSTAHIQYIHGYPDGTFRPENAVTRAEAASIFYGLLEDSSSGSFPSSYTDVSSDAWYYTAVTVLASRGLLTSGGAFRPNDAVTRAEFAEMITRLASYVTGASPFSDISSEDPLSKIAATAVSKGWFNGYPDGTFGGENSLTRAEAVAVFNRISGRTGDEGTEKQMDGRYVFSDLSKSHWAYIDIMEAATSHNFTAGSSGEKWSTYTHEYTASVSWESSESVVNAASITNTINSTYSGNFTHSYNWDYADSVKESYVNSAGYSSSTSWLVWVSRQTQKVYVFTGSTGNWSLKKTFICGTGSPSTPTPTGVTYITYKQSLWNFGHYICYPVVRFYPGTGYAFHSRLHNPSGSGYYDASIGWPVSAGCVRMLDADITYIYNNVPNSTRVVIY